MSGSLPVQYSKIQIRRGPSADLPGMPSGGGSLPTPGLDIGEFGYSNDLGRLFIGIDPTSGLPQLTRGTFPYDNIEIITENSNDFLQTNFDAHVQDMQSGYFTSDTFVYAPSTPVNITINTVPFEISLPVSNAGQALVYYFLYDPNSTPSGNPIKTGILKITYTNGSLEPSVTDCGNTYQNYTGLTVGSDPNVAFGAIQFSATAVDESVILQYLNSTSITPYMYFRIERAAFGEDYENDGGGGGGGGAISEIGIASSTLAISGSPLTTSGTFDIELTTVGVAGTYNSVTIDAYGRTIAGSTLGVAAQQVTGNTFGGTTVDNDSSTALTMTFAQLVQMQGDSLPASLIANNTNLGTTGYFWSQADATANGGSVNLPALFNAAAAWSSANDRAVHFPAGLYAMGNNQLTISHNNVSFLFDKDARITWTYSSSGSAVFTVSGNNFFCRGGIWGPHADTYQDFFTSQITQTAATYGPTTIADLEQWRTVSCGIWKGLQVVLQWPSSTTQLFQANTNITYHDALPINPQTNTQFSSLNALKTYLADFTTIVSQSNLYLCNIPSASAAPTITGSSITAVMIDEWTGYQVVHTPPAGTTYSVLNTSPGVIPGQVRTVMSSTNNFVAETVSIPQPTINFLNGQPNFYQGGAFVIQGDDATFYEVEGRNASGTRMWLVTQGNRCRIINSNFYASDATAGSAYIRISSGDGHLVHGCKIFSGDEALQFVTGSVWLGTQFGASSNHNITNSRYSHNFAVSLGQGPVMSVSCKINNNKQAVAWTSSASVPVGNTITFPDPIPSGLTAAMLQYSSQPWVPSTAYATVGTLVINGTSQYVLATAGTSGSGNGPTGTGSGIADGTCVWNYVAGSAGNASSVYVANLFNVVAGSVVSGYSNESGISTLSLVPPSGTANAIYQEITEPTEINFIEGIPLGAMTNNVTAFYNDNYIICVGGCCGQVGNTDSIGCVEITINNNFFDSSWVTPSLVSYTGNQGALNVSGDAYGGVSVYVVGNRFVLPYTAAINITGTLNDYEIRGNIIDGCQTGSASTSSSINIFGGNVATLPNAGGVIDSNVIWATNGGLYPIITMGAASGTDGFGELIPRNAFNASITKNRFFGIVNQVPAIQVAYGGNHIIKENVCFPAVMGGTDTAKFLSILSTSSGVVISDYNNLTNITGQPYSVIAGGATLNNGLNEMYNPLLGTGGGYPALPTPNTPVAVAVASSGTISSGNMTVTPTSLGDWSVTYGAQTGSYYKVGKMVYLEFTFDFTPTFTTASGNIEFFSSLPFAPNSNGYSGNIDISSPWNGINFPTSDSMLFWNVPAGVVDHLLLTGDRTGGSSEIVTASNLISGNNYILSGAGWYLANS